jgi:hypothetical protein
MGYRGKSFLDTGAIYTPYVPLAAATYLRVFDVGDYVTPVTSHVDGPVVEGPLWIGVIMGHDPAKYWFSVEWLTPFNDTDVVSSAAIQRVDAVTILGALEEGKTWDSESEEVDGPTR